MPLNKVNVLQFKKLIISPHADDEVIGCSSVLDKDAFVYICGVDESKFPSDSVSVHHRINDLEEASKVLSFSFEVNENSKVNHYSETEFIDVFEKLINRIKPQSVFIPCPDYNQDHKAIHHAAIIALRPHDKNFFVKRVLVYEMSHNAVWNPAPMNLNYFVPLDVEKKMLAYSKYTTEVRGMRSPDMLGHVASIRGAAINAKHAEAFEIIRWVD
jgi:N-acetylglucosamine malate deacetylase 1